jgi:hypothetical protein
LLPLFIFWVSMMMRASASRSASDLVAVCAAFWAALYFE